MENKEAEILHALGIHSWEFMGISRIENMPDVSLRICKVCGRVEYLMSSHLNWIYYIDMAKIRYDWIINYLKRNELDIKIDPNISIKGPYG
jgi:hypothetical protein